MKFRYQVSPSRESSVSDIFERTFDNGTILFGSVSKKRE
jgi:hypothetical protein